jgi:hypothetical protein
MTLSALGIFSAAGAGGGGATGTYELIESQILGSAQASVVFSSLGTYSSTYKHLQLRSVSRVTGAFGTVDDLMTLNGITTNSYASHYLLGNGSVVSSGASTSRANMITYNSSSGASSASNVFGVNVVDLLDAFSSSKNTTIRGLAGNYGSNTFVDIYSGLFNNTASITSVTITSGSGNFIAGSRFSLYGIKG